MGLFKKMALVSAIFFKKVALVTAIFLRNMALTNATFLRTTDRGELYIFGMGKIFFANLAWNH